MTKVTSYWRWIVAIGGIGALVYWITRPSSLSVDTARVSQGPLMVTIDEEGITQVRERYLVAAPVTGRLERLTVEAGDSVRVGAPIGFIQSAPLDPRANREATARLDASADAQRTAKANSIRAQEAVTQADRELRRIEALARQGVVSPEVRERAELATSAAKREAEAADFRAQSAAHDVELARAAIASTGSRVVIRAPVAGRILSVAESSERVILAGAAIAEIADPSSLEVAVDLLSTDAVKVVVGDTMRVTGWGGIDTLIAVVRRVAPSGFTKVSALGVEEQRVSIVGRINAPPRTLGDRYRVDVAIVISRRDRVVRVPRSALYRAAGVWRVFTVQSGRAREREVSLGLVAVDQAEIVEGLAADDLVILYPDERIGDGTRVKARVPAR